MQVHLKSQNLLRPYRRFIRNGTPRMLKDVLPFGEGTFPRFAYWRICSLVRPKHIPILRQNPIKKGPYQCRPILVLILLLMQG